MHNKLKSVRTCLITFASRAVSNTSDETTHDSNPRLLRSEADIISKFFGDLFFFFSSSSLIMERNRIPSYPRISGDEVLR